MKRVIVAGFLVLAAGAAPAQPRPSTPEMSCAASRHLVARYGAVVLGTGGFTYDRFVRDGRFCALGEVAYPAWVPSREGPSCLVGYRCRSGSAFDD